MREVRAVVTRPDGSPLIGVEVEFLSTVTQTLLDTVKITDEGGEVIAMVDEAFFVRPRVTGDRHRVLVTSTGHGLCYDVYISDDGADTFDPLRPTQGNVFNNLQAAIDYAIAAVMPTKEHFLPVTFWCCPSSLGDGETAEYGTATVSYDAIAAATGDFEHLNFAFDSMEGSRAWLSSIAFGNGVDTAVFGSIILSLRNVRVASVDINTDLPGNDMQVSLAMENAYLGSLTESPTNPGAGNVTLTTTLAPEANSNPAAVGHIAQSYLGAVKVDTIFDALLSDSTVGPIRVDNLVRVRFADCAYNAWWYSDLEALGSTSVGAIWVLNSFEDVSIIGGPLTPHFDLAPLSIVRAAYVVFRLGGATYDNSRFNIEGVIGHYFAINETATAVDNAQVIGCVGAEAVVGAFTNSTFGPCTPDNLDWSGVTGTGNVFYTTGSVPAGAPPVGPTPNIEEVLTAGDDAGGLAIDNLTYINGPTEPLGAGSTAPVADLGTTPGVGVIAGGYNPTFSPAAFIALPASAADGLAGVLTDGSTGAAGEVLTADGAGTATWEPNAAAATAETYLTIDDESATLPNSRRIVAGSGIDLTDAGVGSTGTLDLANLTAQYDQSGAFDWVIRGGNLLVANSKAIKLYSDNGAGTPATLVAQWNASTGHIGIGTTPSASDAIKILKSINGASATGLNIQVTNSTPITPLSAALYFGYTYTGASGTGDIAAGVIGTATHNGAGALSDLFAIYGAVASGASGAGAITRGGGIWVPDASWASDVPATTYVLRAGNQGGTGATAYGLYLPAQTGTAARSFIADPLVLGTNAAPPNSENLSVAGDAAVLDQNELRLYDSGSSNYIGLKADAARTTNLVYILPATDPTAGQILSGSAPSAGVVTLSWVADSGGAGGGHTIRENGTDQTARTGLNFVDADAGAGLITDDAGNNETEVNLGLYLLESKGKFGRAITFSPDADYITSVTEGSRHILNPKIFCLGESTDHGAITFSRAKAVCGTAGTGTPTIVIEVDDNPAFSSATTIATLGLTTSTEVDDTTEDSGAWNPDTNNFIRARVTDDGTVIPKNVEVFLYLWETPR